MSGYQESRWHEDCFRCCGNCSTCTNRDTDEPSPEGLYKRSLNRFVTMGSVRYGMRLGAVSPPPPGAGPRYRSQCCWPTTSSCVSGPVSRIPLLTTAPINSFDIISCANRVRMNDNTTSKVPQQSNVRDHVLYSTKCLLKSQLKRCTLVRPQIYARLCEYGDGNCEEEDILNNLDRLPRFRFGGNRASSNKIRDFDKRGNEQRLKELADRLKRGPIPPPRTRHQRTSPTITTNSKSDKNSEDNICPRVIPFRSASFSQVDYCVDDKKYIRKRHTNQYNNNENNESHNRVIATLPRSKNLTRPNIKVDPPAVIQPDLAISLPTTIESNNLNIEYNTLLEHSFSPNKQQIENPEKSLNDKQTIVRNIMTSSNNRPPDTPTIQEKKRDKSRRRKGIYISQWSNPYQSNENVIPQFVDDGDFEFCTNQTSKSLEDSIAEISKLQINDEKKDFPLWTSPQEEPVSPEENNLSPEWPTIYNSNDNRSINILDDKDITMKLIPKNISLLRSDSLSEGEPEIGERKSDQISLIQSDVSDCESRISIGNESISPYIPRRYSKRPLRGPYGQMLEAEMKKPETGRKSNQLNDLKFLEDLSSQILQNNLLNKDCKSKQLRIRGNNSIDDAQTKENSNNLLSSPKPISSLCKRKVSADNLISTNENEQKIVVNHQRTTSSPSKLESFANIEVSSELLEQLLQGSSEQIATSDVNLQQKNDTRTHVVVEVYDNERTYVESLQILITKYLEPLKSPENSNLLDPTLVDEIFYEIPFLLNHHKAFLDELRKRLEHWDIKQKVGDVFLDMFSKSSVIESYTNYVNNWKRAREIIKSAQQSKPTFAKFLENTAREHKGKLALDSLLIKPIQKFPKYELLIQRLIKHTAHNHPDHNILLAAQKEVHDQLLKINCIEREALELEQLREIEGLIEGLIDLVSADRQYLRHDLVTMTATGGTRKERALFLFSDLLLVTSIKRRSGTIRRQTSSQGTVTSTLEANKYKLLMKIALQDLEICRIKDENVKQLMTEIEHLNEDISILNQMNELCWALHCNHTSLDDLIKDMLSSVNKQLIDQQNSDSQLLCLDLTLNTSNSLENVSIVFSKPEKRASWEETFNEAKQKLAMSGEKKPPVELVATVPIRKTRAGLQFTCAAPTLGDNGKDVWVCNSDGYVGQVCVLSLQLEPTVTSCNGVCSARILCIASVPAVNYSSPVHNKAGNNHEESSEQPKTIQFDSSSSSEEDDQSENEEVHDSTKTQETSETCSNVDLEEMDNQQSTMWLGTEDGCIHLYNSNDNIRIKKNKTKLQHGSSILCIIYLDNKVYVSLANGDIAIYDRDSSGGWNINSPTIVTVGSTSMPVSKMIPNDGKIWCGCGSTIKIFNTQTLLTEKYFMVNNDSNKPIACIILFGNGVWLSLQNSAILRCFHSVTFEPLCEINVAPAVTKMLISCDDIIRQHKAACLRVTALLACKDLLWIGTSAGVLLTMPLPHITPTTTKLLNVPIVTGITHGHTGHVRFLTSMELTYNNNSENQQHRNSYRSKPDVRNNTKLLIISGGDGYEDFRNSNLSEVAGREDSTNHLLLWNI